ncbi:MAG: hypothetical protein JWM15_3021 [Cryptosporangiaceae bacterium]|jgi:uncharacterized protein (DUF885 family)|nr:hypothetical protein [Cryptosporangiaceae bacterium]
MPHDFVPLAEQIIDDLLLADPELARAVGDHRLDAVLPDHSDAAVRARVAELRQAGDVLAEVDPDELDAEDAVDLELLSAAVDARLFDLTELREHEWNPLVHNPGFLLHGLMARPTAPAAERLTALSARLEALPDALATADAVLTDCPAVHVETALAQWDGTERLIRDEVVAFADQVPGGADLVRKPVAEALAAVNRHRDRLRERLTEPGRDPRLGSRLWEAKLWHALDSDLTAGELQRRAEADLERLSEEIADVAEQLTGDRSVRAALARLAEDRPDNATIVGKAAAALADTTDFVRRYDLVGLPGDPCEIVEMPEFARGVAVAYCDAPGPLEPATVPTFFTISPTPADWSPERVESFYREYNDHLLHGLTVHEAMPGHHVQLSHSRRFRGSTRVRAVCASGSFIEGWAVYAEQAMTDAGYGGLPVKLQQLKMQLRMTINALLDRGVHCADLSEEDAMALMTGRGFQEEGEAAGKWRRSLLTSAQLSTYFVGYTEVAAIGAARPGGTTPRAWHDAMLAHGSPSPRHLSALLGVS